MSASLDFFAQLDAASESEPAVLAVPSLAQAVHVATTTLGNLPDGKPGRINIENRHLLKSIGLVPGTHIHPEYGPDYVFLRKVSGPGVETIVIAPKTFATRDGSEVFGSRIDVRRIAIGLRFTEGETLLAAYCPDGVLITSLPTRRQARRRWEALVTASHRGELTTASLFTGIGTLDAALHAGLSQVGFSARSLWGNDNWATALEAMLIDNPARPKTALACGISEVMALFTERPLPAPTLLIAGIPCKGASLLNVKNRAAPESHPLVGHMAINFASVLQALRHNTPLILVENVTAWADSVSCSMLTRLLEEQGYKVALIGDRSDEGKYLGVNGADYGDMERRRRMALLAYPPQLEAHLDWSVMRRSSSSRTVGEIREPEAQVDPKEYGKGAGLPAKAAKRFTMRIAEDSDTTVGVISSECWKQRVEDPRLRAPDGSDRIRLPLPEEHARFKGVPETMIRSLPTNTAAHTALGNGTTRKVWEQFGYALGAALKLAVTAHPAPQVCAA